jgi:hypothetical protein
MAHNSIEELCDLMPGLELQSDRFALIPAEPPRPTTLFSPQQFSHFMGLPVEVRFMIYEIALQQTIDRAIFPPFGAPKLMPPVKDAERNFGEHMKCPPIVGALALLHTNRELRSESADELMRLALVHVKFLKIRAAAIFTDDSESLREIFHAHASKMPLFMGRMERAIQVGVELWETYRDLKVGAKMYCLVSNIRLGTTGMDELGSGYEEAMVKTGDLLRASVGEPLRQLDWDFDTYGYKQHNSRANKDDDSYGNEHKDTLGYEFDNSSEYEGDDEYGDDDTLEDEGDDAPESEGNDFPGYDDDDALEDGDAPDGEGNDAPENDGDDPLENEHGDTLEHEKHQPSQPSENTSLQAAHEC